VITPGQSLPPIKGPAIVRVKGTKPSVILDGSRIAPAACSRESVTAGAGLTVQDSADVEISGLELRHFCAGIVIAGSHDVNLHDLTIGGNYAAGVVFAGGTHDSVLQDTTFNPTPSRPVTGHAVELAGAGHRNALMGNTFTKYADTAVIVAGTDQTIRDNTFLANEGTGLRASGRNLLIFGNTFSTNGGDAMLVSGAGTRVLDNLMSGNGGKGIVSGGPGVTLSRNAIVDNATPGIEAGAGPGAPVIEPSSTWSADGIAVTGSLTGTPGERYAVEIFLSRDANQAQLYIGTAAATPNASGKATFGLTIRIPDILGEGQTSGFVTATARDAAGSTSSISRSLPLSKK
jgi:hypothetical protein